MLAGNVQVKLKKKGYRNRYFSDFLGQKFNKNL